MSSNVITSHRSGPSVRQMIDGVSNGKTESNGDLRKLHQDYFAIPATTQLDRCLRRCMSASALVQEAMPAAHRDFEQHQTIRCGGMGVVYRATQKSLNHMVDAKILPLASVLDLRQ